MILPFSSDEEAFLSFMLSESFAVDVSGRFGKSVTSFGLSIVTDPDVRRNTGCQIPILRSLTGGTQSHPTEQSIVTFFPISPVGPPFSKKSPNTLSCSVAG